MSTIHEIEAATKAFAEARSVLVERAEAMRDELESVRRRHMRGLKRAIESTHAMQTALFNHIDASRELFVKPRSVVFHGIKVGLQKARPSVNWSDARVVAERVNEHLPEQRDTLVDIVYKPVAAALLQLDAETLKRIGVRRDDGKDSILIKPVDGGIDKLVEAFMRELDALDDEELDEVAS